MLRMALATLGICAAAGCGGPSDGASTLRVFVASSLLEGFVALESAFEAQEPNVDIQVIPSGSQVLRLQIEEGARADVFASADTVHMNALESGGYVHRPRVFARGELIVVVPASNPAGIRSFSDLGRATRLVIGTPQAPIGRYGRQVMDRAEAALGPDFLAALRASIVSEESNVRLVRAKVELGESDAAIVYRSDAATSASLLGIEIPPEINVDVDYVIAAVAGTDHPALVDRWLGFLDTGVGRSILVRHGFQVPE